MMTNSKNILRRRSIVLLVATIVASLAIVVVVQANVREVGETANFTTPDCTDNDCQVITRVTAYQQQVGTRKNPYRVGRSGKVVAFSVFLPSVTKKIYSNFADRFDGSPTAKISILRPKKRRGVSYRYVLAGQSARLNLRNYLGGTPSFALEKPLSVKRGDIIALTTDTWMPGFTVAGQDSSSIWRASRPRGKCSDLVTPRMHAKVDQIKVYSCGYKGARMLYKATVVDTPKKTRRTK